MSIMSNVGRIHLEELESGIIGNRFLPYSKVTAEDVRLEMRLIQNKYREQGEKICLLLNVDGLMEMEINARKMCFTVEQGDFIRAVAIVAKHPISRMISQYTLSDFEGNYPCQIFPSEAEALVWLRTIASVKDCENPQLN